MKREFCGPIGVLLVPQMFNNVAAFMFPKVALSRLVLRVIMASIAWSMDVCDVLDLTFWVVHRLATTAVGAHSLFSVLRSFRARRICIPLMMLHLTCTQLFRFRPGSGGTGRTGRYGGPVSSPEPTQRLIFQAQRIDVV